MSVKAGKLDENVTFRYLSTMGKKVTIDDDDCELLASLKRDPRDPLTKVAKRHVPEPVKTCGELLDAMEREPAPRVDLKVLALLAQQRGLRPHMKK